MSIEHGMIEVNVKSHFSSYNDSLRVAIRDTMGDDIAGYTLEDSIVDYSAEGIRKPVRWKSRPNLDQLKGRTVHILCEVKGAILYAYRFFGG